MITEQDIKLLEKKGITENMIAKQLKCFQEGFPFLKINAAASVGNGILSIDKAQREYYHSAWNSYLSLNKEVVKFVPASGAASRMFKDLYAFLDADYTKPQTDFEKEFFAGLSHFAFYKTLNQICLDKTRRDIETLLSEGEYKTVVEYLLLPQGLNYGNLPKGLLEFHKYENGTRTPFEEHLKEASMYARGGDGEAKIHYTVSTEHRHLFEELAKDKLSEYEKALETEFKISFSEQKPSTDTLAVGMDNEPIRVNKELLFRPGGHGALIENLNDLEADIVFIKNIDNVSLDSNKREEALYKSLLAGVLVDTQNKIFEYLDLIDSTKYTHDDLIDMIRFIQRTLNIRYTESKNLEDSELVLYLKRKLDRPCRVCGMVENVGEPGGGPFIVMNDDKTNSPQILESSQIDMENAESKAMFDKGTHFNPVDIVCGIKDYRGQKFNLKDFVDQTTGFISNKSQDGVELKALELPGLWNGAMSDWNTIFVEVPVSTFNPVKTVNDLLRDAHLNSNRV